MCTAGPRWRWVRAGSRCGRSATRRNYFVPPAVPRFTQTSDLILTRELGAAVARTLGSCPALFLVNHGVVCTGPDLETATVAAILLERACQQQILTQSLGDSYQWTPEAESLAKREHTYNPRQIRQAWDYLVRSLPAGPA